MIQAYIGDGKGKSTAALGLLIRALGAGMRVGIIYFDKGNKTYSHHELNVLERLGVRHWVTGLERMQPDGRFRFGTTEEDRREAGRGLAIVRSAIASGEFDLLVLDEIITAASFGLITPEELTALISDRKASGGSLELVLTGRCANEEMLAGVDLISRVTKVRHYFDSGTKARPGIEY
ncbi:MAG TPA: cob(I)yrinic acid a,c-diamide adenosyltransferase [Candidatus Ozemobacteraceae bacterium]|nr:cob(I)yrinic acid a,c-diamide adenosyltransferase [Candidatus Ozemobacteraceae bacterium]HQG28792.1 cob(I)yrinic acid a,c-diamide adenosyltransferase [Candidatus Ozemobacteraceae bacterium]